VLALWNYAPPVGDGAAYTPGAPKGATKHFEIDVTHLATRATASVWRLDTTHGNVLATFDRMGRPAFPTRVQIAQLRAAGREPPPQTLPVNDGRLSLEVPPQGLVIVTLGGHASGK